MPQDKFSRSEREKDLLLEWLTDDAGFFFRESAVLADYATPYQRMAVHDTPALGKLFRLDGYNMTSERDEFFYHENLVHPACVAQNDPRRALVIGGGDGGSSEEILKHPSFERVVMAELDPEVLKVAREHFHAVHRGALDDPRLEIKIGDGYAYLRETKQKFDLVVMDLTDPIGPAETLYSVDFYSHAHQALSPTGCLTLHIGSPVFHGERFTTAITRLKQVFKIVRPYLVNIPIYGGWWGMACASDLTDPLALSESEVENRIRARKLSHLQFYNSATHRAVFALPNFVREHLK